METIFELNKFKDIKYFDKNHSYFYGSQRLTSVTTLIGQYTQKFPEEYQSKRMAGKYGLTQEQVLYAWEFMRDFSNYKGTIIHDFAEDIWEGALYQETKDKTIAHFGYDAVAKPVQKIKEMYARFYYDYKDILIPVKAEMVVGDPGLGIAGMFDRIFYNTLTEGFEIWDWKTNKEYHHTGDGGFIKYLQKPLNKIVENHETKHAIQLSLYQYLLEKNTNLKFTARKVGWFFEGNEEGQIFEYPYMKSEVEILISDFNKMK